MWKACFSESASIDDVDIMEEGDASISKQVEIIDFLSANKDKISINDWKMILDIVINVGNYEEREEEGYNKTCETCGDWNYKNVFYKNDDDKREIL